MGSLWQTWSKILYIDIIKKKTEVTDGDLKMLNDIDCSSVIMKSKINFNAIIIYLQCDFASVLRDIWVYVWFMFMEEKESGRILIFKEINVAVMKLLPYYCPKYLN